MKSLEFGNVRFTSEEAQTEAQKIAFGPIMFQAACALYDLGILKSIAENRIDGIDEKGLADKLNLSEYGVTVLIEAGMAMRMIFKEEGELILTKLGHTMLSDEMTDVNMKWGQHVTYQPARFLKESIEKAEPAGLHIFGNWPTIYPGISKLPGKSKTSWFEFDHYYSDEAFPELMEIVFRNRPKTIFDVGGNTGKFSVKCAEHHPEVKITLVDLPEQVAIANENIKEHGLQNRIGFHAMNVLDPDANFPTPGPDIIWMSQFLDCFSKDQIVSILKKATKVMKPSSRLYILEILWDKQRYEGSAYSVIGTSLYFTCLANGNSKMYHSKEMESVISKAGLEIEEHVYDIAKCHTLLICKLP